MISIVPALEFMRHLCGAYVSEDGRARLKIWSCGYAVALDLQGPKKSEFVGVIGAFHQHIECFAVIGLPNAIRFLGIKESDNRIVFTAEEPPLKLTLALENELLQVSMALDGNEKVSYGMRASAA